MEIIKIDFTQAGKDRYYYLKQLRKEKNTTEDKIERLMTYQDLKARGRLLTDNKPKPKVRYNELIFVYKIYKGKGMRSGQAFSNALSDVAHDIFLEIKGNKLDPFYDNRKLGDFFDWLYDNTEDK